MNSNGLRAREHQQYSKVRFDTNMLKQSTHHRIANVLTLRQISQEDSTDRVEN